MLKFIARQLHRMACAISPLDRFEFHCTAPIEVEMITSILNDQGIAVQFFAPTYANVVKHIHDEHYGPAELMLARVLGSRASRGASA